MTNKIASNTKLMMLTLVLLVSNIGSYAQNVGDVIEKGIFKYKIISKNPNKVKLFGLKNCINKELSLPLSVIFNDKTYNLTSIGENVFFECTSLTSITIPNSVTSIDDFAFKDCMNLTTITIPSSVTKIGMSTFRDCKNLISVTIPHSVKFIGKKAFKGCKSLTKFSVNSKNTNYKAINGVLFSYALDTLIQYPADISQQDYIIPNSVKIIGKAAFTDSKRLISITIPNSVNSINDNAFEMCCNLTSLTIPNNVTNIGKYAFYHCRNLRNFTVNSKNKKYKSINGVLFNYEVDELIKFPEKNKQTEYVIPSSVKAIGNNAFVICGNLKSVTIPNSVISIGNNAFDCCKKLTSITIPNSVKTIGNCAFLNCTSLKTVTITSSSTHIGEDAFTNCSSLNSINSLLKN